MTESGVARGGTAAIERRGFPAADIDASGRVIAWLADTDDDDPAAAALLGQVISAPRLAASWDAS